MSLLMGETVQKVMQMGLMIGLAGNSDNKISDKQYEPENNSAELDCENTSTSSLHSDPVQLDESEDPDSLQEDDSDAQNDNSGVDSVEDDITCNLDHGIHDGIGQAVS
jgi:hypothetical protein